MAAVVTNVGLAILTQALTGTGLGTVYLAVGTGAGTAGVGDSAMFTEDTTAGRVAVTLSRVTKNVANDTVQAQATMAVPVAYTATTWTEVGLFTAATGGTLIYHRDGVNTTVGSTNGTNNVQFTEDITL